MLKWTLVVVVLLPALVLLAGQAGWLSGQSPTDLGVHDGRLKAPSTAPNSVSSQAGLWPDNPQHEQARIDPLPMAGDGASGLARIKTIVIAMPGARIVTEQPDYLYVRFTTRWLRFVDDAEFWVDPAAGVIQVRSASRLGHSDLGANRARIEAIRAQLAKR